MQRQQSLALSRLNGHEPHGRTADGFADGFRVRGIGLVALHIGIRVLRRDQSDIMTKRHQFASLMMRARARFHPDEARRQTSEEGEQIPAANAALEHGSAVPIDTVQLKDRLREIETDGSDRHGRLLRLDAMTTFAAAQRRRSMPSSGPSSDPAK